MYRYILIIWIAVLVLPEGIVWAFDVPEKYRGGVTVVHSDNMPPMSFLGLNGEPKGFVIDFWRKWSNETGVPVSFRLETWKDGLELLKNGECDIHGGLYETDERRAYLDYSNRVFPIETALFSKNGSGIDDMDNLKERSIGVLEKGSSQEYLRKYYPELTLSNYASIREAMAAFAEDDVDAIVTDYPTLMYLSGQHAMLKDVYSVKKLFEAYLRAAVVKGNSELLDLVSRGIAEIDQEERDYILHRWYVNEPDNLKTLKIVVTLAVVGLLGALVFLIFGGRARRSR